MTVYLLHFMTKFHHAQHYLGYTNNLPRRLEEHRHDTKHLMGAVNAAGIQWVLAREWPGGDRELERRLKRWGGSAQFCPFCQGFDPGLNSIFTPPATPAQSPTAGKVIASNIPCQGDFTVSIETL